MQIIRSNIHDAIQKTDLNQELEIPVEEIVTGIDSHVYLKIKPCDTVLSIIFNTFTDELTNTVFNSN